MKYELVCPGCSSELTAGHLKWSSLCCPDCLNFYDQEEWLSFMDLPDYLPSKANHGI